MQLAAAGDRPGKLEGVASVPVAMEHELGSRSLDGLGDTGAHFIRPCLVGGRQRGPPPHPGSLDTG